MVTSTTRRSETYWGQRELYPAVYKDWNRNKFFNLMGYSGCRVFFQCWPLSALCTAIPGSLHWKWAEHRTLSTCSCSPTAVIAPRPVAVIENWLRLLSMRVQSFCGACTLPSACQYLGVHETRILAIVWSSSGGTPTDQLIVPYPGERGQLWKKCPTARIPL